MNNLDTSNPNFRSFSLVTFYSGYSKDRPTFTRRCEGIDIGTGKRDWGAEPGTNYFRIKLGEIVSANDR